MDKLTRCFVKALGVAAEQVTDDLAYRGIPQWDSVAHMALVAEIEDRFDIMLEMDDVLDLSSVAEARRILAKYVAEGGGG